MPLAYPHSATIWVFEDDGAWPSPWHSRSQRDVGRLHVATYQLPVDADGDVDLTTSEWDQEAATLEERHPGCLFVY